MHFTATNRRRAQLLGASIISSAMFAALVMPQAAMAQDAQPTAPAATQTSGAVAPDANRPADEVGSDDTNVVVTGYRAALQSAINTKRKSNNIVDVIKADDMASFPDANLAESIQRIPGVSIQRDAGEGRNVTVRGLGGDFVRTTLNGIEAFSTTTGSTLGVVAGLNRTRGFDYSTFASELFNSVSVSKSQSAEMDEGSLAATIDLQTARPFDRPGLRGAASIQGAYYDINKSLTPRVAGLISNTFGNFGVLVSGAYSTRKAVEDGYSDTSQSDYSDALNGFCGTAVDIPEQAGSQVVNTAIPFVNALSGAGNRPAGQCFSGRPSNYDAYKAINQPNIFLPRNPGLGRFSLDQKRLGLTGAVQWRPSDATHLTFDTVFSRFDQDRTDYALSLASNNRNVNGASAAFPLFAGRVDTQIMDVNVDENGQVDYMKLNNVDIKHIQEKSRTRTKTHEMDLIWDQKITDRFGFTARVGHAGSNFNQPWDAFVSYDAFNKDNYIWDARDDTRRPFISYGYDVTNPANVTFTNAGTGLTPDIRLTQATVKNTLKTASNTFHFDINDNLTLKFGGMFKDFDWVTTQNQRFFGNNGPPCVVSSTNSTRVNGSPPAPCPAANYQTFNFANFATDFPNLASLSTTLTGWGDQLGLPDGSVNSWVVPDVDAFIEKVGILCNCANKYGDFTLSYTTALGSNRSVSEKDLAFFAQTDFNFDIGGHGLRGNVGLRHVKTDMTSQGYLTATTLLTANNRYKNWLPSMNMAFDVTPDVIARFAAAKVMSRPQFAQVTPGGSVNTTFGAQSATIGNPFLKPYGAKNFDLSLEYYPQKGAFYGVALFYRKVDTMIQNLFSLEPYGDTGLPLSLLPAGQDATTPYNVTRSRNTSGGYIKGLELSMQQPLTFLPGALQHLGVAANYTFVKSSVLYYLNAAKPLETTHDEFPNVSKHAVNATVYYDDDRFSTHLSLAYRTNYLVQLPFKASLPDGFYSYGTLNVDASAQYKINKNIKLTFDALNLTNQAGDQYSGKMRKSQRVFSKTGRQFFFGAGYSF
ncbi:MAG: TonB-dependent receptor [Sphingomicrobium sp.]